MACLAEHRFGISTHLFHESRLTREHLVHIAAHGFEAVELFATRSHFDYHDDAGDRASSPSGCPTRASSCTPCTRRSSRRCERRQVGRLVLERLGRRDAAGGGDRRNRGGACGRAAHSRIRYLVVHLGMPTAEQVPPSDNQPRRRAAQRRGDRRRWRREVNVRVALEVIPNALSSAGGARAPDRGGPRRPRRRHLPRLRPRAPDGRPRRSDRNRLRPSVDDARARQRRQARRSSRAVCRHASTGTPR